MKNKIFVGLSIIILIGIIVVVVAGFNVDFAYKNYHFVNIEIGQDFNISDIEAITNEVFPNEKLQIQKAGVYKDNVVIKVTEISEEQKNNLNTKINEKYGLDNKIEDITVNYIPSFRLRDLVKPYIIPMSIAIVATMCYMIIRFRSLGIGKVLVQSLILTGIAELLYVTVVAITRYPINRLFLPVGIVIYMAVITVITEMFEKQKNLKVK